MSPQRREYAQLTTRTHAPLDEFMSALVQEVARADAEFQAIQRVARGLATEQGMLVDGIEVDPYARLPQLQIARIDFSLWFEEVRPGLWARLWGSSTGVPRYRLRKPGHPMAMRVEVAIERAENLGWRARTTEFDSEHSPPTPEALGQGGPP